MLIICLWMGTRERGRGRLQSQCQEGLRMRKGQHLSVYKEQISHSENEEDVTSLFFFNVFMFMKRNTLLAHDLLMTSQADTKANTRHNNSLNMWILWNVITAEWILYNTEIIVVFLNIC